MYYENFDAVVRHGMMGSQGMPNFNKVLSEQQVQAIYAYVLIEANALREEAEPSVFAPIVNAIYDVLATFVVWILVP